MQKRTNSLKVFSHTVKKIFRSRNVIIISEHKVDHVPLSTVMQVLMLLGFLGFFSGISYITGSYMASRSVIMEKERKIISNALEKNRIHDEMNALKIDLARLSQNGSELNAYSKFLINQHSDGGSEDLSLAAMPLVDGNLFGQNTGKLLDRISFLENRISEIKDENEHLVTVIRERTDRKINYLQDVISMTGLDVDRLEDMEASQSNLYAPKAANASPAVPLENVSDKKNADNQGGPFIPYDKSWFNTTEQALVADVDRVVTLYDIVQALPLSQPINEARQVSPFGKRVDPINHRWAMHPGLDLAGPTGARVFATNAGVVIKAGRKPAYGNMVDVEHKFGIVTRYAHLSKILVHPGDKVARGQLLGIQGSTGRSTGPHLHYEVRIDDHPVNPLNFLNAGEYVSQE